MPSGPRHGQGMLEGSHHSLEGSITAGFERASAVSSPQNSRSWVAYGYRRQARASPVQPSR